MFFNQMLSCEQDGNWYKRTESIYTEGQQWKNKQSRFPPFQRHAPHGNVAHSKTTLLTE